MPHTVHNVHERVIAASPEAVWDLLSQMGTDEDPVYPAEWGWVRFPDGLWPWAPMIHNAGPEVVHGTVTGVEPGRKLWFGDAPAMEGGHGFMLEQTVGGTRIQHILHGDLFGVMRIMWPAFGHLVHDETIERIFDNLEQALTGHISRKPTRTVRTRLLRHVIGRHAAKTPPPDTRTDRAETASFNRARDPLIPVHEHEKSRLDLHVSPRTISPVKSLGRVGGRLR